MTLNIIFVLLSFFYIPFNMVSFSKAKPGQRLAPAICLAAWMVTLCLHSMLIGTQVAK